MSKDSSHLSPPQNLLLGSLAVFALLLAFGLSFWVVSRGFGQGWHNRAQTQIRSPAEEAQANAGWDPNRLLGGLSRSMPAPSSWADNFGKPLAYTKGIDADSYLYPEGSAPAPGSLIFGDGDEILDETSDSSDSLLPESQAAQATAAPRPALGRDSSSASPVGGLLNR